MATINSVMRAAMRHAETVQRMIDASGVLDSMRAAQRWTAEVQKHAEAVERMLEKARVSADTWAELRWPPPWHLPARVLDQIAKAYREKKVTPEDVARIFIDHYVTVHDVPLTGGTHPPPLGNITFR